MWRALQRMVRSALRPSAPTASPRHRPRSSGCSSSSRSCSAASLAGAPSGSMTISCSSASKTSAPISRGPKPASVSGSQDAPEVADRAAKPAGAPAARGRAARCRAPDLPLLRRRAAPDRRDRQRDARPCAGTASGHPHLPAALWLPGLRDHPPGACPGAADRQGPGHSRPAAHVLVSKYCDHLPLYRQSQIFARQGVELDRSTLANWVGGAVWWLEPLQARLAEHVFASQTLFADDTPIPVLDPGRGRTKTGRLWVYARDDRPWNGPDPPAAVYLYSPDRQGRASGRSSGELQGRRSGRRLSRLRAAHRRRRHPAGGMLGPCAAQVLRGASGDRLARSRPKRCGASPSSMRSRPPSEARPPSVRQERAPSQIAAAGRRR